MRTINQFRAWAFQGTDHMRPFNTEGLTIDDVIELLEVYGYFCTEEDINDLVKRLPYCDLMKLWDMGLISLAYCTRDLFNSPQISYDEAQKVLESLRSITPEKIIPRSETSDWDVSNISRYIDISEVLKHKDIFRSDHGLEHNQSMGIEHVDSLGYHCSHRDSLVDRGDPDLCLEIVRTNPYLIDRALMNPNLTAYHIVELISILPSYVNDRSVWISEYIHIDEVIKAIILLRENGHTIKFDNIWMNRSITPNSFNTLRDLLNEPERQLYYGCNLEELQGLNVRLNEDNRECLVTHPEVLRYFPRVRNRYLCQKELIRHSRIDLLIHCVTLSQSDIREIMHRPDITLEDLKLIDSTIGIDWSYEGGVWYYGCNVSPEDLCELSRGKVSSADLSSCKGLKIDQLSNYNYKTRVHLECYINLSEIPSLDLSNHDIVGGKYECYITVLLGSQITSDQWEIMRLCQNNPIPLREVNSRDPVIVLIYDEGFKIDSIDHSGRINRLARLGHISYLATEIIGTIDDEMLDPHIEYNWSKLCLQDLCELIEPYYHNIRGRDISSMDLKELTIDDPRFYHLLDIGAYQVVRNCFKPMAFKTSSLEKYSDIEIITV